MPYGVRQRVAEALGLALDAVRVTAPDVGGGFGTKGPGVSRRADRRRRSRAGSGARCAGPTRGSESFVSTTHAGDQLHDATLALDRDGEILALADDFLIDAGAYLPRGAVVANVTATHLVGLYRVPVFRCRGRVVVTHKVPCAPYRGAGRPQAVFVVERLIDIAARELGLDPVELRRRNLIRADEMPYQREHALPRRHADGPRLRRLPALLETALERGGYADLPRAPAGGATRRGGGSASASPPTTRRPAIGPHEGAHVAVERERPRARSPSARRARARATRRALAQICAERLGVPLASVDVTAGDTARFPASLGTYASRVAVHRRQRRRLGRRRRAASACARVAARALECDAARRRDRRRARRTSRASPDRGLSLAAVLALASRPDVVRDLGEPGLAATRYFSPESVTWAAGVHVATVEVDRRHGRVDVLAVPRRARRRARDQSAHRRGPDAGRRGAGHRRRALGGDRVRESGQPLTGTLMDYGLPRADSRAARSTWRASIRRRR